MARAAGAARPATFALTDAGRATFPHAYDDLALTALRYVARIGGEEAVTAVRRRAQLAGLEERCRAADGRPPATTRSARRRGARRRRSRPRATLPRASAIASGGQLCQHHCPVAHVAAEFPQLCEAETAVIGRLVGTHVQRLATIAHGDGVCTTHIPAPMPRPIRLS